MTGLDYLSDESNKQDSQAGSDWLSARSACGQKLFDALDHHYAPRASNNCFRLADSFNSSEIPGAGAEVRANDYHRRYPQPARNEATGQQAEPSARSVPKASDRPSPHLNASPRDYVPPYQPSGPRTVPEAPGVPGGVPDKMPDARGLIPRYAPGHPHFVPAVPPGGEFPPSVPAPESIEDSEPPSVPPESQRGSELLPPNGGPIENRAQFVPAFEQELAKELEGRIANATNKIVDSIDSNGQIPSELRKAFYDYLETKPVADNVEAKLYRHLVSNESGVARVNLFLALKGSAYRLVLDNEGSVKQLALVGPGSQVVDCVMLS